MYQSCTYTDIVLNMLTNQNPPEIWWEHVQYVALSHLTSLKGLHVVNLNESNMCVSTKVWNYLSGAVFQQKLELSYVPVYHFVHNTCRILYNNVSSIVQKANYMKENQNMKSWHVMFLVRLGWHRSTPMKSLTWKILHYIAWILCIISIMVWWYIFIKVSHYSIYIIY